MKPMLVVTVHLSLALALSAAAYGTELSSFGQETARGAGPGTRVGGEDAISKVRESPTGWVDLLELADPARDTVAGVWTLQGGKLIADHTPAGRISFPYYPPQEYDFLAEFTLSQASGCTALLMSRDRVPFTWSMNAGGPPRCRLEDVNGHSVIGNPTRVAYAFEPGKRYISVVRVRRDSVTCLINDQVIAEHKTDYGDLSRNVKWAMPDQALLGLGVWNGPTTFHRVAVRETTGQGTTSQRGCGAPVARDEFAVNARAHHQEDPLATGVRVKREQVLQFLPSENGLWHPGRGELCDYRGQYPRMPHMRLHFRVGEIDLPVTSGIKYLAPADGEIKLYCWDRKPTNNRGAIGVKIVVDGVEAAPPAPAVSSRQGPPAAEVQPVAEVCTRMAAKQAPQGLRPDAIPFTGPRGDGRSGGNGLLIAAPKGWLANGTQWTFLYERSAEAYGFQTIHPWRQGHALVTVTPSRILISTCGSWAKTGWGGGDSLPIVKAEAYDQVMPIEPDRKHLVTSELDPEGNYRLWIDELLVASATIRDASPLGLIIPPKVRPPGCSTRVELEFAGQGLPQALFAGQAGVILGPRDWGHNVASRIRFTPIDGPGTLVSRTTGE